MNIMTVYRIPYIVWGFVLFLCFLPALPAPAGEKTIVPPGEAVSDFDARLALAQALSYDEATLNDSVREYEILSREQPRNAVVLTELAGVYARLKQYPEALERLKVAIALKPDDKDILRSAGDVYLYSGDHAEAEAYYKKAYSIDPGSEEAKKKLAFVLSWQRKDDEAFPLFLDLYKKHPDDKETAMEAARLYARRGEHARSLLILGCLLSRHPDDPELLVELADIEAGLGHAKRCRELYERALGKRTGDDRLLLQYAERMKLWGDFYRAERIYTNWLKKNPWDAAVMLKLAKVYGSAQQYEKAEGTYRKLLLKDPRDTGALLGLATLKLWEKDFEPSVMYADRALSIEPKNPAALAVKGEALIFLQKYKEAQEIYMLLAGSKGDEARGYLGAGKACLKRNKIENAGDLFNKALEAAPDDVEARFYAAGFRAVQKRHYIEDLREGNRRSPSKLTAWANLYMQHGYFDTAISLLQDALNYDPDHFPAKIALAQTFGISLRYAQSIAAYEELEKDLPGSSKILIEHARVLGWSGQYGASISLYEHVHTLNPGDTLPLKEMARVAMWGKMPDKAMEIYASLFDPSVDKRLREESGSVIERSDDRQLREAYGRLTELSGHGSIYQGYEAVRESFENNDRLRSVMIDLLPAYRTQKTVALESEAKRLSFDNRFARSMPYYEELMGFDPVNEEAYFDYAQVECALGLCDREKVTYGRLLNIDPLHNLAGMGSPWKGNR